MILTCPDVCVIKRCMWAAVNWKSTGWTTFELYLEKCDDVMYITQEVTVLSLERYLKLAICYILVCCLHTIHTIQCRLVKYHEIFICLFSPMAYAGWNCDWLMKHGSQRIRSSRTAATSMDVVQQQAPYRMPFLFHKYHNIFGWIEYISIPLKRYIYIYKCYYIYMYIHALLMYSIFIDS